MIARCPDTLTPAARRTQRVRDALTLIADLLHDLQSLGFADANRLLDDYWLADGRRKEDLRAQLLQKHTALKPATPYLARRIAHCLLDPVAEDTVADVLTTLHEVTR